MFWPLKQRELHFADVRTNDRVQLDIAGKSYTTRVEDVLDGEVHVAAPLEPQWERDAQAYDRVIMSVFSETGFLRYLTRITRTVNNRVSIVVLAYVKDLGALDRRGNHRVAVELPVRYRIKAGAGQAMPWFSAVASDVSRSGLRAVCESMTGLRVNDYVDMQLLLPSEDHPLKAVAQVVWVNPTSLNEQKPCFGAHYVIIQPPVQVSIDRFVKSRHDYLAKVRRQCDCAPAELPVRYRWQVPDGWTQWRPAVTTDVSGSGIRLIGERPGERPGDLHAGDQVEVQLSLPDSHKPVVASGRVARLTSGVSLSGEPSLAVQFETIDEGQRKRIIKYVQEKRSKLQRVRQDEE